MLSCPQIAGGKAYMRGTKLREKTLFLLKNRAATIKLKDVAEGSGLTEAWVKSFHLGKLEHPSVVHIETLYEYLTKSELKI
jgi:hypothetical protein